MQKKMRPAVNSRWLRTLNFICTPGAGRSESRMFEWSASFGLHAGFPDDLLPFAEFGFHELAELLRRVRVRFKADRSDFFLHLRIGERFYQFGVQPVDDRLRCPFWRIESIPCGVFELRQSGFGGGRKLRSIGNPFRSGNAERNKLSAGDKGHADKEAEQQLCPPGQYIDQRRAHSV